MHLKKKTTNTRLQYREGISSLCTTKNFIYSHSCGNAKQKAESLLKAISAVINSSLVLNSPMYIKTYRIIITGKAKPNTAVSLSPDVQWPVFPVCSAWNQVFPVSRCLRKENLTCQKAGRIFKQGNTKSHRVLVSPRLPDRPCRCESSTGGR